MKGFFTLQRSRNVSIAKNEDNFNLRDENV